MMKIIIICLCWLSAFSLKAQNSIDIERPKLVVGIIVDQMRYDYLTRFYNKYSDDGFKRLINEGYNCENAHFNYIPTATAVGHSSVYTGTTPSIHGMMGNYWYDKFLKKQIYCVDDDNYKTVGTATGGKKSPYRLITTTVADELRLAQNMKGKSISISIKDRSAILPVGHTANAAYWFQGKKDGKFITSTYYMKQLPKWVNDFNASGKAKEYLNKKWETLYNINTYTESIADDNEFESTFKGKESPTFPYKLSKLAKKNENFELLKATPFGNSIVIDFAKEAIIAENLGGDDYTDFLAISFSSTDYIGHQFGVDSKEVQDAYLRLDKDIADFLKFLDKKIGKNDYTLFLTADHAAVQVPAYLQSKKIPANYIDSEDFKLYVLAITQKHFKSKELIEHFSYSQLFLDKSKILELKLDVHKVAQILADEIINYKNVHRTVTAQTLQNTVFEERILHNLQNGYNQRLSGDVFIIHNPATISYLRKGSTHGSAYIYDTHVPIIFYGKGIKKGTSKDYIPIIDIAPTLSNLLNISFPNGNTGNIIKGALK
ncbi:MAG: alkaline phosphatase family protein [Flavobacteriaceae bacterium]|nr:alkaline phosphatase family protein [Flavobacteriaceae bacterium]